MPDAELARIGRGFDALSLFYDDVVRLVFGKSITNLKLEILSDLPKQQSCLIIGGGSGRLLKVALDQSVAQTFIYAELSEEMKRRTQRRLSKAESTRVEFIKDFENLEASHTFDIIVLPFVLDCYPEERIHSMLKALKNRLNNNGRILFIDFNLERDFGFEGSYLHRAFIAILYLFFRASTRIPARRLARFNHLFLDTGFVAKRRILINQGWIQAIEWIQGSMKDDNA